MANILQKWLGGSNEAEIRKLEKIAQKIDALEDAHRKLSDAELKGMTDAFRARLAKGETLDSLLPEAFSVVREAMGRVLGKRHFHVQMLGGIVLHQGRVAEMKTGEGKTFVAILPAYLNALTGEGVHIVTVNDYLAKFQGEWMGKVFRFLGMRVGIIIHDLTNDQRRDAYQADITYGTNNEMGFDYLRDNMVIYRKDMVQRGHAFAIVDEADSILIDEARTPLIISGQGDKSTDLYQRADRFMARLREEDDYTKDEKDKTIILTEAGIRKAEQYFGIENLSDIENNDINHHINAALRANVLMHRDDDYVVQNGQVIIVDEFTGRLMVGRRYSDGLHQAIEAKEHVTVERESKTLATITFQNYFRMYKKLSGMTGTAKTEEEEFKGIYHLDVVQMPTNKPMIRKDLNDTVYKSVRGKFAAVVEEIIARHATGQPVLVGTVSVEKSEQLSRMLELRGVPHEVLNAKHHEKEAEIVAQAGHYGAVTIATNMAGRGTDILLGGNPEFLARRALRQQGIEEATIEAAMGHDETVAEEILAVRADLERLTAEFTIKTDAEHERVIGAGGLHIIGTERHESRRIDNQLRGRAGRQGDPGSSQFFIALEDDLMRLFGSDRFTGMMERLGMDENTPIEAKMLTKQIEGAQKRIESRNYDIRRHVLQYDDVMNQQRDVIYGQRRQVLSGEDMRAQILGMVKTLIEDAIKLHTAGGDTPRDWDLAGLAAYLEKYCLPKDWFAQNGDDYHTRDTLQNALIDAAEAFYQERELALKEMNVDMREFERVVLLSAVDRRWMDHIDAMDRLRDGIGLRAYGHKDPVVEYKFEGFEMFDEMVRLIREDTLLRLYHAQIQRPPERVKVAQPMQARLAGDAPAKPKVNAAKVGRNAPCPCGSGLKYKHCHGKEV
ncbi:MAG: preprotein translocase subunit SecA [Oscillospiraceae bacterium]|jgi:preprotein translocase subunit SecA|nr:preprotein translocase subunit SecA [Oscillospiraceae bacterium]